jgi:hypothetical protein
MSSEKPTEDERKKIAATYRKHGLLKRYAIYAMYFVLLLIAIKHFLKQYPAVEYTFSIIIIVVLLVIFYLVIKSELIKKR